MPAAGTSAEDARREQPEHAESANDQPSLSLPKAGGAIRGMGEKFTANAATGTASLTVPLALTGGRAAITPQLVLSYDSGAGNGPFGLGWNLDVGSVSRVTDKGVPRYLADDVFQLNGAEDLVPASERTDGSFVVTAYRPRTEGLFARLERWRDLGSGDTYWRVTSKDNVTRVFGRNAASRISDPADPNRVLRWLVDEISDDRGDIVRYEYKPDGANRYLKRVRYGNRIPGSAADFCFEAVFDYGEHDQTLAEVRSWPARLDAFSTRRGGFELRTRRLCERVLMFHRFSELGPDPVLVTSTDLTYRHDPALTFLTGVVHRGYIRDGAGYRSEQLAPLTFEYTERQISAEARSLGGEPPARLDGRYQWADLDGEGISGILAELGGAWFYRANLGGGAVDAPRVVEHLPSGSKLSGGRQLVDLAGEGRLSLTDFAGTTPGFHRRTADGNWADFAEFAALPKLRWDDPNLRMVDLTGDGLADVLLTADDGLTWYPSAGTAGFGDARQESSPRVVFADAERSIHLADMTGDGLADLVRIGNGEITYWPSLGHGRFGPKVLMAGAPTFDHPDLFDQRRVHLSDVDGSAPADLVYGGPDGVRLWFNQAGNSWSAPHTLDAPGVTGTVAVADVLGKGTACLVVAEQRPDQEPQVRYVDLMAGAKPHLLRSVDNHMGLRTTIRYESSTTYYLADKAAGRPWVTRPPFPVQVVAEIETRDTVADTTLVSAFTYRHGYFDGAEREFRGFGYVEQRDSPSYADYPGDVAERLFQPPTVIKRWQHTGWYPGHQAVSRLFADDYWQQGAGLLLPDTTLPAGLTTEEERQATRALRGQVLREEIYAEDGTDKHDEPYRVTEHSYTLRLVQPQGTARNCVVFAYPAETLTVHSEREVGDPRVAHSVSLEVDEWGNLRRSAQVSYSRQTGDAEHERLRITATEQDVTNDVTSTARWRVGVPVETREYEIGGGKVAKGAVFQASELDGLLAEAASRPEVRYQDELTATVRQRRLISRTLQTYSSDDLTTELPRGVAGARALPWRTYSQAFADGHISSLYGDRVTAAMITEAGYVERSGVMWSPSGREVLDAEHFYLPLRVLDPFGAVTSVEHDPHYLTPVRIVDPVQNVVHAEINYRVVRPWLLTDPNGNRTGVRFDALGMVISTAVLGKGEGDVLDLSASEQSTSDDPTTKLTYDLHTVPVRVHTSARERHGAANPRWQESTSYSDGSGRLILRKIQAEPGLAPVRGPDGRFVRDAAGELVREWTETRWVGTGRVVHDNKGQPVKQFQPYFAPDDEFDTESDLVSYGVTPVMRYDPLGRLVLTEHPDGTLSKVEFDAWEQRSWDQNDMVTGTRWYAERIVLPQTDRLGRAARLAGAHAGTYSVARFDSLGHQHMTVENNGGAVRFTTTVEHDVQGHERIVRDARGAQVREQKFDMLGHPVYVRSPDAGERWSLLDVTGKQVRAWDSRGADLRWRYDGLRRPTHSYAGESLLLRYFYGESADAGQDHNLRTRPYLVFDGAGVVRTAEVDFKGNVTRSERKLALDPRGAPDWAAIAETIGPDAALVATQSLLENTTHATVTEYDAMSRPTRITTPDASQTLNTYNAANLLDKVAVRIRGAGEWTPFVTDLQYDARGERTLIELGCGVRTRYEYEHDTFRLSTVDTRTSDGRLLQGMQYTYDPVGNIVQIDDSAQQTIFFANTVVSSARMYEYEPTYRLRAAEGREHIGQTATEQPGPADPARWRIPHVNNEQAMRRYREEYEYDQVGNFRVLAHKVNGADTWRRRYSTAADSNRLLATSLPGDAEDRFSAAYQHDANGNIVAMPHIRRLDWDVRNQLVQVDLGEGGMAYYQYDAKGQRVRAVIENGGTVETRVYLGQSELYRKNSQGRLVTERETLHVSDGAKRVALVETLTVDSGQTPPGGPRTVQRYQLSDHLESAAIEVDKDAALLSYEEYHPFGTTSFHAGEGAAETSLKRYRFTGKEKDDKTGLYYHGARYYAPWLARWISPDPAGFVVGTNLYDYCGNRPVVMVDRDGRYPVGLGPAPVSPTPFQPPPPPPPPSQPVVEMPSGNYTVRPTTGPSPSAPKGLGLGVTSLLAPAVLVGLAVALAIVTWTPNADAKKYRVSYTDPDTGKTMTFRSYDEQAAYLNEKATQKRIAPGAQREPGDATLPGAPQPQGDRKDPVPDKGPASLPAPESTPDSVEAPGTDLPEDMLETRGVDRRLTPRERASITKQINSGQKLTTDMRNLLRGEARVIWQEATGKKAPSGWQVHHLIPLEYAHLFPGMNPNDKSNLMLMPWEVHRDLHKMQNEELKKAGKVTREVVQAVRDKVVEMWNKVMGKMLK